MAIGIPNRYLWLLAALLLCAAGIATADAATLHAQLIRATNDAEASDPQLQPLLPELSRTFGYKFYRQIGSRRQTLPAHQLQRLDLGEGFVLFARLKHSSGDAHEIELEWYSGKAKLTQTTATIPTGRRLLIKGPAVGKDWIVLAVTVPRD